MTELAAVADRLQAGPPGFLEAALAAPEDQRREVLQLAEDEAPPASGTDVQEAAGARVFAEHPELVPERGLQDEQRLIIVQEAIREWGARSEEEPKPKRPGFLIALAELVAGFTVWLVGLADQFLDATLVLFVGVVMIADATYRWQMHFSERRGEGVEAYLPLALVLFRFTLVLAVLLYSVAAGAWSFDSVFRVWYAALGTVALLVALWILRGGKRRTTRH